MAANKVLTFHCGKCFTMLTLVFYVSMKHFYVLLESLTIAEGAMAVVNSFGINLVEAVGPKSIPLALKSARYIDD